MIWWQRLLHPHLEEKLDQELSFHLDQHIADLVAQGHNPHEARRLALVALGQPELVKEYCRDSRTIPWLENLSLDIRYGIRAYRRTPGFTLTALLAIVLGIASTSAVFSITDRILFRHLPYSEDKQLVSAGMLAKVVDDGEFLFATDYKYLSDSNTPFQSITSWSGVNDCDITDQNPIRQQCAEVDFTFLNVLGVHAILGTPFTRADSQPGSPRTVMLAYGVWQSHFGASRSIIGQTLVLDGAPARIIGVLPASFELPTLQHADILVPQVVDPAAYRPGATRVLRVIGRLKDGIALPSARAKLQPFFSHMLAQVPAQFRKEVQFRVRSIRERQMGDYQLAAWTLLAAVLAVMLISLANVANLLLARMAGRQTEISIRTAIGISRTRLLCQLVTESLLLSLAGGVIGCALGSLLLRLLVAVHANSIPHLAEAKLDGRVLALCFAISLLAGLIFGLVPALQPISSEALSSSHGVAARFSTFLKNALVASQLALSIVLLACAGLLSRSLWNLETQSLGMYTDHVLAVQLILPPGRYTTPAERVAFFNQLEQRMTSILGVRAVGFSDSLPPAGWERSRPIYSLDIVGHPRKETGTGSMVNWRYVSPGYFDALRIPVIEGRAFNQDDRRPGVNLCILSESLARRLLPSQSILGQQLTFHSNVPYQIVGIVPDVKNTGLSLSGAPEYYILRTRFLDDTYLNMTGAVAQRTLSIVLRGATADSDLISAVKHQIAAIDPYLPIQIGTMHERLDELTAAPRFYALLLIAFSCVGLLLAAVGLYGTISYLVTQRTKEVGIRMSLGATPAAIAVLMLRYSVTWTLIGVAIGIPAALLASKLLSSLLFRVSSHDPLAIALSVATLLFVSLLATLNPIRRAASLDPVRALRNDN